MSDKKTPTREAQQSEHTRPTVEEMNKRVMRNGGQFKVYEFFNGRWYGRYEREDGEHYPTTWYPNGDYLFCEPVGFDLIEPIEEWHEDVSVTRRKSDGQITSNDTDLSEEYWSPRWKERRYYKKENGVVKFIRSEVIDE